MLRAGGDTVPRPDDERVLLPVRAGVEFVDRPVEPRVASEPRLPESRVTPRSFVSRVVVRPVEPVSRPVDPRVTPSVPEPRVPDELRPTSLPRLPVRVTERPVSTLRPVSAPRPVSTPRPRSVAEEPAPVEPDPTRVTPLDRAPRRSVSSRLPRPIEPRPAPGASPRPVPLRPSVRVPRPMVPPRGSKAPLRGRIVYGAWYDHPP